MHIMKKFNAMKKKIIIIVCFLLLTSLQSCRKKSRAEKKFEKTTRSRLIGSC